MANEWDSVPSESLWYGCVIVETPDGETDYFDGYSSNAEDTPNVDTLAPDGWEILERTLLLTPLGHENIGEWAREEQVIPSE